MSIATQLMTPEQVEAMGDEAERYELWFGVPREVEWMSEGHGIYGGRLAGRVGAFVIDRRLGEIFISDSRFVIPTDPPSLLGPDLAFVRADRLPKGEFSDHYSRLVPDLVVEVVSPTTREPEVLTKVEIYLQGGVRLIWLVRPARRTITVVRPGEPDIILGEQDVLDGGDVLPGFRLAVADVFRR